MRIEGVQQNYPKASKAGGIQGSEDAQSKSIRKEIERVQKQMQQLSENDSMSMEEKMKKRQELNQQINELQNELRQHQMEVRREQQKSSEPKAACQNGKQEGQTAEQAMIAGSTALKQAKAQERTVTSMEGRAAVLEVEIKLDGARGGSTKAKQEELAKLQERAANAQKAQMQSLAEANGSAGTDEVSGQVKDTEKDQEEPGQVKDTEKDQEEPGRVKDLEKDQTETQGKNSGTEREDAGYPQIDLLL